MRSAPPPGPQRRRRFAGFEVVEDLGSHLGVRSYKAVQTNMARTVVLHVLVPAAAKRADCVSSFERRMRVAASLRHANVASAIDAGTHDGVRWFVTEWVDGTTLHDALAVVPRWDVPKALAIALDVARALAHLEELGLVHRDVSPWTITLGDAGAARLADFRKAKFHQHDGAETWHDPGGGRARYMSPESSRGDRGVDVRGDVYSLGCVLFHLLTGRPPFAEGSDPAILEAHQTRPAPDVRSLRPDVPAAVAKVVDRCLQKRREARYESAAALVADLESAAARSARPPDGSRPAAARGANATPPAPPV